MHRAAPEPPWTLLYADGAANLYRLVQVSADQDVGFAYLPVTPAQSSSGSYCGGQPRQARIGTDDPRLDEVWRQVAALAADASRHCAARTMGSGAFTLTSSAGARRFIVARGAALEAIEALLRRFGD